MAYDRRAGEADLSQPTDVSFDFRPELGRVFVAVNVARDFVVLDADRATTLRAWTAALIPAHGARPAADEIGAAEYIDATAFLAPRLRAPLLSAIDALDREALMRNQPDSFSDAAASPPGVAPLPSQWERLPPLVEGGSGGSRSGGEGERHDTQQSPEFRIDRSQTPFAECNGESRAQLLQDLEASRHGDVLAMIRELTYEAYYAHPRVLEVLAEETGWQYEAAFSGGAMEPFDEGLLERMKTVAPHYRRVAGS